MLKRIKMLGAAALAAVLVTGSAHAATAIDIRNTEFPEPATMMLLGAGLLVTFRARRHA